MCTSFTLTYTCGHTQTSHRCPRSTVFVYAADGSQVPNVKGCADVVRLGAPLADVCIACKMAGGTMPGAPTGLERWAAWGAREEGMAVRMRAWRGEDVGLESGLGAAKDSEGVAGRKDEEKAVVWGGREPFGGGDMVRQAQQVLVFVHGEEAAQRMTGARGRGLPLGSAIV